MLKNTFSEKVKREITKITYDKEIYKYIFYAFILNNGSLNLNNNVTSYNITITQNFIVRYIKQLINMLFDKLDNNILYKESHFSHGYLINITNIEVLEQKYNIFLKLDELVLDDNTKKGFLIGAFLSSGSIYFATKKSSYSFEIRSSNLNFLNLIQKILNEYQIVSSIIQYRNYHKLYFKKSEYLSDVLKIMDAEEALFEFEDTRIKKDFSNSLQRLTNLEVSNINKTIIASKNHIEWINHLKHLNLLEEFDEKTQIFCEVRLANPDASLSTISQIIEEQYKIYIPRTSMNHIIKRIQKKYNDCK